MATSSNRPTEQARLERLLSYLESDPANPALLADVAEAAVAAHQGDLAQDLLERRAAVVPPSSRERGLAGLANMHRGRFEEATAAFELLLNENPADAALRFNLAWSRAMGKHFEAALEVLDATTVEALPQAAMLEVQLLHQLARFEEAETRARVHIERHGDHQGLMAAVSVLAIDIEDLPLATLSAARAGDHPDALTTLGTLALGEDRDSEALSLFSRALETNDKSPRAWVGVGLCELAGGEHAKAGADIEHGARLFDDHIGSWIAAGWAWLVGGDLIGARRCFERALAIDANFGESQGSLAVLSILEGDVKTAERLTEIALRLDKQSFAAALARSLLLEAKGKPEAARLIIERALNTPIDQSGRTIAQSLARRGLFA